MIWPHGEQPVASLAFSACAMCYAGNTVLKVRLRSVRSRGMVWLSHSSRIITTQKNFVWRSRVLLVDQLLVYILGCLAKPAACLGSVFFLLLLFLSLLYTLYLFLQLYSSIAFLKHMLSMLSTCSHHMLCMCSACALHVLCMCSARSLHVFSMCSRCSEHQFYLKSG